MEKATEVLNNTFEAEFNSDAIFFESSGENWILIDSAEPGLDILGELGSIGVRLVY